MILALLAKAGSPACGRRRVAWPLVERARAVDPDEASETPVGEEKAGEALLRWNEEGKTKGQREAPNGRRSGRLTQLRRA